MRCFLTRLYLDLSPFMLDMISSWWSGWLENTGGTIRRELRGSAIEASIGPLRIHVLVCSSGVNYAGPLVQKRRLSISQSRRRKVCRIFGVKQFQYTPSASVPPEAGACFASSYFVRRASASAIQPRRSLSGGMLDR